MNESKIKAILFDMDGVLYDSMPYHTLSWQRMMQENGLELPRDEFYQYEGMTGRATINLIWQREFGRDCDPERIERMYHRKTELFVQLGRKVLMPGAAELLDTCRRLGLKRVLVTGSAQSSLLDALEADYPGAFLPEMRVTAHDVTHGKPHPEPYLRALEKAGVSADEAIVVENAPLGVKAGAAAGIRTLALMSGPIPEEILLDAGAYRAFASHDEIRRYILSLCE